MNRNDYLFILRKNLHLLPLDEIDEIIADVNEHFELGIEAGKLEEDIAKQLGDPVFLADQYTKDTPRKSPTPIQPKGLLYVAWMGFIAIIVLGPVLAIYACLAASAISGAAFIIAGIAFAFAIFITTMLPISLFAIVCGMFGFIILGVSLIRLSILLFASFNRFNMKWMTKFQEKLRGESYA